MRLRHIITLLILLIIPFTANARKAQGGTKTLYQPDGTIVMATLSGDEFGHILTTTQGNAIVQGEDGYYYYARFDADGNFINTGSRVGAGADAGDVRASLAIPYETLAKKSALRRSMRPLEEKTLFERMRANHPATKAGSTTTKKHGIVILVNFKDVSFKYTKADFVNLLTQTGYSYNGAVGCAKEYFDAQFHGEYDFDFEVYGPVTVSQNRSYYGGNDSNDNDKAPEEMIIEACELCDSEVDFSLFDDDNDGEVDNVFVFYAGGDEAESAGADCIWSHAWYIKDGARIDLTLDGKVINRYACTSELMTRNAGKTYFMAPIGTFCHEYTHTFGINDMYDTDYSLSTGTSNGLFGSTSLMDSGNDNNKGNTPPYYNAIEREILGIGTCSTLEEGSYSLEAINNSNIYYKVESDVANEYFLIECRQKTGWDLYCGGEGLLVYHVDKSRNSAGKSDTYGKTLTAAQRWAVNEVNANPKHQCAAIVTAYPSASSASQVFFPYSTYNNILPEGKTPLKFWSGKTSGISITNISYSSGTTTFNVYGKGSVGIPPEIDKESHEAFQTSAIITFTPTREFTDPACALWGKNGKATTELQVKSNGNGGYTLLLDNLEPYTAYEVKLWFEIDGTAGVSKTIKFNTAKQDNTAYPYIYVNNIRRYNGGTIVAGAKIPLVVYNAGENVNGIYWYYNGSPISRESDGYYTLAKSGVLKAEIIYKDGSKNYVAKEIIVK